MNDRVAVLQSPPRGGDAAGAGGGDSGSAPVESGAILFPLLVLAHYRSFMFNARYGRPGGIPARYAPDDPARGVDGDAARQPTREAKEEARRDYERSLAKFQASEGTIENAFWCVFAPSAVALTGETSPAPEASVRRSLAGRADHPLPQRDRLADECLSGDHPAPALLRYARHQGRRGPARHGQAHRARVAVRRAQAAARRRRGAGQARLDAFGHRPGVGRARRSASIAATDGTNGDATSPPVVVLSATGAAVSAAAPLPEITRHARNELLEIERYYDRAGNKAARIVYFWGMVTGTFVALGLAALLAFIVDVSFFNVGLGDPDVRNFFVCFAAGALGALVSVLSRMKRRAASRSTTRSDVGSRSGSAASGRSSGRSSGWSSTSRS